MSRRHTAYSVPKRRGGGAATWPNELVWAPGRRQAAGARGDPRGHPPISCPAPRSPPDQNVQKPGRMQTAVPAAPHFPTGKMTTEDADLYLYCTCVHMYSTLWGAKLQGAGAAGGRGGEGPPLPVPLVIPATCATPPCGIVVGKLSKAISVVFISRYIIKTMGRPMITVATCVPRARISHGRLITFCIECPATCGRGCPGVIREPAAHDGIGAAGALTFYRQYGCHQGDRSTTSPEMVI